MALLSNIGTKALIGTAAIAGLASSIGPSAREAAMDVAFGDPNADRAFMGNNLSARFLLGAAIGGPVGVGLQATAPGDVTRMNYIAPSSEVLAGGSAVGALAGGTYGFSRSGSMRGRIGKGILGAAIGGSVFPAAATVGLGSFVGRNKEFYSQSPYANRSSATAAALNASGDIVLGMHNSRNGF